MNLARRRLSAVFYERAIRYLFRDWFSVSESSPIATPRTSDPGPGSLIFGASLPAIMSIVDAQLVINGTPTNGTSVMRTTDQYLRKSGRTFHFYRNNVGTGRPSRIGFGDNVSDLQVGLVDGNNAMYPYYGTMAGSVVPLNTTGLTSFYLVMTDNGGHIIADNGATKKLLWTSRIGTLNAYAKMYVYPFAANNLVMDNWEVYDIASPYTSDYGIATARVEAPSANETITGTAEGLHEFTWTPGAGETETFMIRRTDDDNCFKLVCTQGDGTIKLYRRQGGSDTELNAGKTQTWTIGTSYRIIVITEGTSIKTWVEEVGVGFVGKHNVTDAFNQTATGVKTSLGGNNLVSFPLTLPSFTIDSSNGDNLTTWSSLYTSSIG